MTIKKAACSLLLTIAVLIMAGCPANSSRRGKQVQKAKIEMRIVPQDAVIIIDDTLVGNAFNYKFLELEPGVHKIEIRKEGYEPFSGTINAGQTLVFEAELKKIE